MYIERCNFTRLPLPVLLSCNSDMRTKTRLQSPGREVTQWEAVIFRYLWNFIINFNYLRTEFNHTDKFSIAPLHQHNSQLTLLYILRFSLIPRTAKKMYCRYCSRIWKSWKFRPLVFAASWYFMCAADIIRIMLIDMNRPGQRVSLSMTKLVDGCGQNM